MKARKITAAVLAAALAATSTAVAANASDTSGGFRYYVNSDGTVTITGFDPFHNSNLEIPSKIDGKAVTAIGKQAFNGERYLESVTIPDSVTSIGEYAFAGCSFKSMNIPNSVTSIGIGAFINCYQLTSVNIPNGVTSIREETFYNCPWLTSVTIPDSVTSIGECAFYECKRLPNVNIPDSVTSIGNSAFFECDSLKTVNYTGSEEEWNKIKIGSSNFKIAGDSKLNATIYYDYTGSLSAKIPTPKQLETADVNGDGAINAKDATMVLKMVVGIEEKNGKGDVNSDKSVNAKDATELLKYVVGLSSEVDGIDLVGVRIER